MRCVDDPSALEDPDGRPLSNTFKIIRIYSMICVVCLGNSAASVAQRSFLADDDEESLEGKLSAPLNVFLTLPSRHHFLEALPPLFASFSTPAAQLLLPPGNSKSLTLF